MKTDPFASEVRLGYDFLTTHRPAMIRYGSIAGILLVLGAAFYFYRQHESEIRQDLLTKALIVNQGTVGGQPNPIAPSFPTQAEKDKAVQKAFGDLAAKYPGTPEGTVAEYVLASQAADKGDMAQAAKRMKDVVDNGGGPYVSLAKISLAKIYASEGKTAEAETLVRSLVAKPSVLVSKDAATLELAEIVAPKNPKEAKALLSPLRGSDRSAISKAAMDAYIQLKLN